MKKIKIIIIFFSFFFNLNANSNVVEIKVKIDDEIITNLDIENEENYLTFLNPKLKNLDKEKVFNIAKNSLITEIIKKKELAKFVDLNKENNLVNIIERNLLLKKNIKSKNEYKKILNMRNLDYEEIKKKLLIEALWNQLIYQRNSKNIVINKEELRKKIEGQIEVVKKKYEYNLSEIVFEEKIDNNFEDIVKEIKDNINNIGFENTAIIFSISSTAKNAGRIGWINELQVSQQILKKIENLNIGQISEPIKVNNSFMIIKVNKKKEFKNKIDLEKELEKLIKLETNRQLNNFSIIFYKRLRKNLEIYEY